MSKEINLNYRIVMTHDGTVMGYAEDAHKAHYLAKGCAMYTGYVPEIQTLTHPKWKSLYRITEPETKMPTSTNPPQ